MREATLFLALAFGLSWSTWLTAIFLSRGGPLEAGELVGLGAFGPAAAGLLLSMRGDRAPGASPRPRWICFAVVTLLAWLVLQAHLRLNTDAPLPAVIRVLVVLPAMVPAWIMSGAFSSDRGLRDFLRTLVVPPAWRWIAMAAVLLPLILATGATLARTAGAEVFAAPRQASGTTLAVLLVIRYGHAFFYGGGVGQEPGWRGYLLPRLLARWSPLEASLILWFAWAAWYAPLDYTGYAGATWAAYLRTRVFLLLPLTVLVTWLYIRSGRALLAAAIFHAAFLAAPEFVPTAPALDWLLYAWAGGAVLADRMWRRPHMDPS